MGPPDNTPSSLVSGTSRSVPPRRHLLEGRSIPWEEGPVDKVPTTGSSDSPDPESRRDGRSVGSTVDVWPIGLGEDTRPRRRKKFFSPSGGEVINYFL